MNTLDVILLCCFIPAVYFGIKKGFVKQIASLVALCLGAYLGYRLSITASAYLKEWIHIDPTALNVLSFIAIFITTVILVNLLGTLVQKIISVALLGWLDRLLGVLLSILKYAIVLGLVIMLIEEIDSMTDFIPDRYTDSSAVYGFLSGFTDSFFPYMKNLFKA